MKAPEPPTIYAIQLVNRNNNNNNSNSVEQMASDSTMTTTTTTTSNDNSSSLSNGRIFLNKEKAMKAMKEDPANRRFKTFKNLNDAYAFSYESAEIESGAAPTFSQVAAALLKVQDAEKLPFSAPKKPEINQLRQFIEKDQLDDFKAKIMLNPRFLISAGDSCVAVQVFKTCYSIFISISILLFYSILIFYSTLL
jgi:hypothetical protein